MLTTGPEKANPDFSIDTPAKPEIPFGERYKTSLAVVLVGMVAVIAAFLFVYIRKIKKS